jgi:hypothetical protein
MPRQIRQRLRRVELIVKATGPSLALRLQFASPSLDATAVPDRYLGRP